jgi:hypothetical protein
MKRQLAPRAPLGLRALQDLQVLRVLPEPRAQQELKVQQELQEPRGPRVLPEPLVLPELQGLQALPAPKELQVQQEPRVQQDLPGLKEMRMYKLRYFRLPMPNGYGIHSMSFKPARQAILNISQGIAITALPVSPRIY